jgi:UBX domain-containing protein 1
MINSNRAPHHLLNIKFGQRVEITVEKKTNEKYKAPPAPPMKPFGGQGNRLGAPVPAMVGESSIASVPMNSGPSSATPAAAPAPATSVPDPSSLTFQVDSNQPTTQIQIRLGDGQRMVAKFNHTHTVGDVRQYINASHPGMTARAYTLQASFPPKPLTDEAMSIQEAGLINSVVIQKWS